MPVEAWRARLARLSIAVLLPVLVLTGCPGASEEGSDRPPNIVLILVDDLGYADIGVHGSKQILTPHIDSVAEEGVRFSNGYATSPVCGPSRAGLLTGRYPLRIGMHRNSDDLPAGERTIAEILRDAGYATGIVGKWHLGQDDRGPLRQGFQEYTGFHHRAPVYEEKVGEFLPLHFSRQANAFIERHADEPFFLYVAFSAPHAPVHASADYLERFTQIDDPMRRAYVAMVSALDDAIGRVLEKLREKQLDGSTLLIFLNDNGGAGMTSQARAKNAALNTPLRGFKQDLYEGGIRVPFLVRWPGRLAAGQVYASSVSAMDLFPTIAAAAGVELPADLRLDGVDLLPYLSGDAEGEPHPYLFWKHHQKVAVRHGAWKLVDVSGRPALFDLDHDPAERKDLASQHPEVVRALSGALEDWLSEAVGSPVPAPGNGAATRQMPIGGDS